MNIDKYLDVINACRFCFMCRHLPPVGNVTFKEADTPRGRALIADRIRMNKENLKNPDYIKTMYESAVSAANRYHCVSHYDEAGLVLAVRQDIVEAGQTPEKVIELGAQLQQVDFKVSGAGDTLYYVDINSDAANAPAGCKIISGGDTGKALQVLGFAEEAAKVFAKFKAVVAASGCKTVVTSCPASYDMMKGNLNGVEVKHSSEYIKGKAGSGAIYYLDSDFLKNYQDNAVAPRETLSALGYDIKPFGTNPEESYTAGEGAVVFDQLCPELAEKLCARIVELADNPATDILVTASPYTKSVLNKYASQLNVMLVDQLMTEGIA
jgi:Fe-S oxidoreductase